MQALNELGVVAVSRLGPGLGSARVLGGMQLGPAAQHRVHRGAAGADGLVEVGAVLVQVAHQAAQLAGGVQALDGLIVPVEHLALDVALGAAGAGGHGGHFLDGVEGAGLDLGHGGDIPAEIGVLARVYHGVEVVHLGPQGGGIAAQLLGQLLNGVRLHNPALLDLHRVVRGPVVGIAAGHRPANPVVHHGLGLAAVVVEDDVYRLRAVDGHVHVLAVAVVLHVLALIGIGLVVVTGAVRRYLHPRAVDHVELTDEAGFKVGHLDAVEVAAGHGVVVHVPQLGAYRHLHLDAVAGDVGGARVVDAVAAVEVPVHLQVALVAAGGQQNALAGLHIDDGAVGLLHRYAVYPLGDAVLNQADHLMLVQGLGAPVLRRLAEAVPAAAVLKGHAAVLVPEVTGGAYEIRALQQGELHQQGAPAQRAAAGIAHFVAYRLQGALNPLQVGGELVGQPVEVLLGDHLGRVQVAHVGAEGFNVLLLYEDDALAGGDGLAPRVGLVGFVVNHHVHVGINLHRLDVGGGARHAVAGDDDVVFLVPGHVLAGQAPATGVFVALRRRRFRRRFGLGRLAQHVHTGYAQQAHARRADGRAPEELFTGNVLAHFRLFLQVFLFVPSGTLC